MVVFLLFYHSRGAKCVCLAVAEEECQLLLSLFLVFHIGHYFLKKLLSLLCKWNAASQDLVKLRSIYVRLVLTIVALRFE